MQKRKNEKLSSESQARVEAAKERLNFHNKIAGSDDFIALLRKKLSQS